MFLLIFVFVYVCGYTTDVVKRIAIDDKNRLRERERERERGGREEKIEHCGVTVF